MAYEKRKKVVLSIEQKIEGLKRLDKGESRKKVASALGVSRVTVGDWEKNRRELEKWCANRKTNEAPKYTKTMKRGEFGKVSEALFMWFTQQREKGRSVTGPMLIEKARIYHKKFNEGELSFAGSIGWLYRWKRRYGVKHYNMHSQKRSTKSIEFKKFKSKLQCVIDSERLTDEQIYNCDISSLNYKMLPLKKTTLNETEKVTIMACSNATGNHKLELAISYKIQNNMWMGSDMFRDWFFNEFVPSVKQFLKSMNLPAKAILIINNLPVSSDEDDLSCEDIRVFFSSSWCQPMQEALNELKKKYRHKLLTALIAGIDNGNDILEELQDVKLKDVICWITQSWEEIKSKTLVIIWRKFLLNDTTAPKQKYNVLLPLLQQIPGCENMTKQDVDDWLNCDQQQELTDDEILAVVNENAEKNEADEQETKLQMKRTVLINHSKGASALETALRYVEQQEEATDSDVLLLRRWCDIAANKKRKAMKKSRAIRSCNK